MNHDELFSAYRRRQEELAAQPTPPRRSEEPELEEGDSPALEAARADIQRWMKENAD